MAAKVSAVEEARYLSNSGRAACLRASNSFFTTADSASSVSHRGRSSIRGTKTVGGVSLTLPSIAAWVVLLKKAESS